MHHQKETSVWAAMGSYSVKEVVIKQTFCCSLTHVSGNELAASPAVVVIVFYKSELQDV